MSIKVQGLDEAIRALSKYGDEVARDTAKAMNLTAIAVEKKAKRNLTLNRTSNTGDLRSSIHTSRANKDDLVSTVYVEANYAPYVEFGTKTKVEVPNGLESYAAQFRGKGGSFEQLEQNISAWAKNRGIPQKNVKFIAMKIARFGVKAQPFLFPAWESERPKLEKAVKELLQR
jgi:HK97 gp10 family phage protein